MKNQSKLKGKKVRNRRGWKIATVLTAIMVIIVAAYITIVQSENSSEAGNDL